MIQEDDERLRNPEEDRSQPQSTKPQTESIPEEKKETTVLETIETSITNQIDKPVISSHFEQEISPIFGEKVIRIVILWASPLGYKRFENFRYSFALNLPPLTFLDFTDELKETLR